MAEMSYFCHSNDLSLGCNFTNKRSEANKLIGRKVSGTIGCWGTIVWVRDFA